MNKKSIANHEQRLFQTELDKYRPHQNRLLQANHKQTALMKELTKIYGNLLQDRRVKFEQNRYENFHRQHASVLSKYKKIFNAFNDVAEGLSQAQSFYSELLENLESLEKNVEAFVNNRRSEGAQLLNQIERDRQKDSRDLADRERDRLRDLMEQMSTKDPVPSPSSSMRGFQPSGYRDNGPHASSRSPMGQPAFSPTTQHQSIQAYQNLPPNYVIPPPRKHL